MIPAVVGSGPGRMSRHLQWVTCPICEVTRFPWWLAPAQIELFRSRRVGRHPDRTKLYIANGIDQNASRCSLRVLRAGE